MKMMLMAGAFLGAKKTLLTILAGSVLGSVIGVAFILARGKDSDYELPFGTFPGHGSAAGGVFRHAGSNLVPVAAPAPVIIGISIST